MPGRDKHNCRTPWAPLQALQYRRQVGRQRSLYSCDGGIAWQDKRQCAGVQKVAFKPQLLRRAIGLIVAVSFIPQQRTLFKLSVHSYLVGAASNRSRLE